MNILHFRSKKQYQNIKDTDGFSFIETLLSVVILAITIAGVLSMTSVSIHTNFNQINHTKAVKLAEEGVERKLREDFDTLAGESSPMDSLSGFPTFSREITVDTIDNDNKLITVSVTWRARSRSNIDPITLSVRRTR